MNPNTTSLSHVDHEALSALERVLHALEAGDDVPPDAVEYISIGARIEITMMLARVLSAAATGDTDIPLDEAGALIIKLRGLEG